MKMEKCDICGKNSLLPERFGTTNICKSCFLKIGGLVWKKTYYLYDDAEKNRCKALANAHKHNYPQSVIASINQYFMQQISTMKKCECCGRNVQNLMVFGKANICLHCFDLINNKAWKCQDYEDNEQVEENRSKILRIAQNNNFPAPVVEEINYYFNQYIQEGLLCTVDGGLDQKIKVFQDRCLLITDENFDLEKTKTDVERGYEFLTSSGGTSVVGNVIASVIPGGGLVKGLVNAGVKAASATANTSIGSKFAPINKNFIITKGKFVIHYKDYLYVDYRECSDNHVGYIRFISKKTTENYTEDVVFFFRNNCIRVKKAFSMITEGIFHHQNASQCENKNESSHVLQTSSVADELLKFKNLLDIGAITQDEYDNMKKQLLSKSI